MPTPIGYGLLVPLMLTSAIAIILVPKRVSIYEEQVDGSLNSPAHFDRYLRHVADKLRASPAADFRLVDDHSGRERVTTGGSAAIDLSALGSRASPGGRRSSRRHHRIRARGSGPRALPRRRRR